MQHTHIEWTHFTANPLKYRDADGNVVWGCIHASPGCQKCYAEALAKRYSRGGPFNTATMAGLTPFMDEKELRHMLTYRPASGQMCFVGDMTDLFGEWVPFELIDKLFAVFALRHDVTWQILTKRPERMLEYTTASDLPLRLANAMLSWSRPPMPTMEHVPAHLLPALPLRNVWLGVSCENQEYADKRIPLLLQTPAAVRFVSYEPAIGPVNFGDYLGWSAKNYSLKEPLQAAINHLPDVPGLDWIIAGGESGPGSRPFNIQWARDVVRQCRAANVAVFVKQMGGNPRTNAIPGYNDAMQRVELKDRKGGEISEWEPDLRVREFPEARA